MNSIRLMYSRTTRNSLFFRIFVTRKFLHAANARNIFRDMKTETELHSVASNDALSEAEAEHRSLYAFSPLSGCPCVKARPGQAPVTSEQIRELLADFP